MTRRAAGRPVNEAALLEAASSQGQAVSPARRWCSEKVGFVIMIVLKPAVKDETGRDQLQQMAKGVLQAVRGGAWWDFFYFYVRS